MKHTIITSDKCVYILLTLSVLMTVPVYFYGFRPLVILAVSLGTAFVCEALKGLLFRLPRPERHDYSSAVTAMIITLLMPPTIAYYVPAIATGAGLMIAKYPFGGTGKNIFNPAALGAAVVAISMPDQVLRRFPVPGTKVPLSAVILDTADIIYAASPASVMTVGGTPKISRLQMLLGDFPGAMGATCVIALLGILLFLCICRVVSYKIICSSLFTVFCYAVLFPRTSTGRMNSVIFEITSGVLLFGIIFMASDPYTSPLTSIGQLLYGGFLALSVMVFRTVGAIDVEFVFVLLVLNAFSREFDRFADFLRMKVPLLKNFVDTSDRLHRKRIRKVGERNV